jgi:outer membrane protein
MRRFARLTLLAAACLAGAVPALAADIEAPSAQPAETGCPAGGCHFQVNASELLATADNLVSQHRFAEAAPLLAALENAPQYAMERQFLIGYSAIESGDTDSAIKAFRSILAKHPEQTRVRLELARALQIKGNQGGADYHYRLAQQSAGLPPEVLATIHSNRSLLRDQRSWSFNVNFGLAPDTNISNGTRAQTIDADFGGLVIPLTLDASARQKSGIGQTLGLGGSYRFGLSENTKLLVEADATGVNYAGSNFDDYTGQLAVGPEFRLSDDTRLSVQALGSQRWYGGNFANRAVGARASLQHNFDEGQRIGLSLDARQNHSGFSSAYSGWQIGAYASYERVVAHSLIASATLFGRRDSLASKAYSGMEFGANLGIGGELPLGINAGISGGISRQVYDGALAVLSPVPRKDLRINARVHMGLRTFRFVGFSPSVTYTFSESQSSLSLYDSKRHRFQFGLARYF